MCGGPHGFSRDGNVLAMKCQSAKSCRSGSAVVACESGGKVSVVGCVAYSEHPCGQQSQKRRSCGQVQMAQQTRSEAR